MTSESNSVGSGRSVSQASLMDGALAADGSVQVSIKTLFEAGAHFGHQTQRWNPKMLPYIYGARNGIHIVNLELTMKAWQAARKVIVDVVSRGGNVLFVGTKPQAKDIVEEEAKRCGAYFVTKRWLGGTLSNLETIRRSLERLKKLEDVLGQASIENSKVKLNKKERLEVSREIDKLRDNLGGIREMRKPPELLFVVDVTKEAISVAEAARLKIPVVALVDTNVDPSVIQYPIPANDDASRTIKLLCQAAGDAVLEGRKRFETAKPADEMEKLKQSGEVRQ